jgi:hypothetical protein
MSIFLIMMGWANSLRLGGSLRGALLRIIDTRANGPPLFRIDVSIRSRLLFPLFVSLYWSINTKSMRKTLCKLPRQYSYKDIDILGRAEPFSSSLQPEQLGSAAQVGNSPPPTLFIIGYQILQASFASFNRLRRSNGLHCER